MKHAALLFFYIIICTGCAKQIDLEAQYGESFHGKLAHGNALLNPKPQEVGERTFLEQPSEVVKQFTVDPARATEDTPPDIIVNATFPFSIDNQEEYLYTMHPHRFIVKKFSVADGTLLATFTALQDHVDAYDGVRVPGMRVMENDELWIMQGKRHHVLRLSPDGEFIGEIELPRHGDHVEAMNNGTFAFLGSTNFETLFRTYTLKGKKENEFGILSSVRYDSGGYEMVGHGGGFTGEIRAKGDAFVYSGFFGARLLSYTSDGELRYYRKMIDDHPFPGLVAVSDATGSGAQVMRINYEQVVTQQFAANIWGDVFYQLTYFPEDNQTVIVDAYAFDTGDYLYSMDMPENCYTRFVTDQHVYAACKEQGVLQFNR